MSIQENTDNTFEILESIGSKTAGILTTKQIEDAGIYRGLIRKFVEDGILVKESKGLYSLASEYPDEYVLLQSRSTKMIFSYGTALYLWGMSDRIPHTIDVTVPQGCNLSKIKRDNDKVRFHYVKSDKWDIGLTETQTNLGNTVKLYDKERCICDLIMIKKEIDKQLYVQALKEYFSGNYNARKIIKYGRIFNIEEKVRDYMEILT